MFASSKRYLQVASLRVRNKLSNNFKKVKLVKNKSELIQSKATLKKEKSRGKLRTANNDLLNQKSNSLKAKTRKLSENEDKELGRGRAKKKSIVNFDPRKFLLIWAC